MSLRYKIGLIILAFFAIFGFILPFFNPYPVQVLSMFTRDMKPSYEHWLGTNSQGQDIFWLLVESLHNSLLIGIIVAFFATVIGVLVGLTAGFVGGFVDRALMLITDAIIVIPSLPILILMGSLMRGRATLGMISVILIVFNWPWPCRQVRSMALTMREREFINTARFSSEGTFKIITTEILPYVFSWSLSNFINTVLVAIAEESGLAVLGLSSATLATLGNMIFWAREYQAIMMEKWLWIGSPVVATMLLFIGLFMTFTGYSRYTSTKRGR